MVSEAKLREIAEQKALLVAQCDLHRGIIAVEITRAKHSFDWFDRVSIWIQKVRPWMPLAAPVAGFFVAKNWRTMLKWSGRTLSWKLLSRLLRG